MTAVLVACTKPASSIDLALEEGGGSGWIRVRGLTGDELERLRTAVWREAGWHALMHVTRASGEGTPLPGRYVVSRDALEFHPTDPFEPGQPYRVRFDPSRLPLPRASAAVETIVVLEVRPAPPPTVVRGISPTGDEWPANVLRFYVHFSAPMSRTEGQAFIRLLDDRGQLVEGAVTLSALDFWNIDRTRYTGFLNTGRSVRGDNGMVSPLKTGREYSLLIDPAWRDASGRPLAEGYRRAFRVGPPVKQPLTVTDSRITPPAAGTTQPLVVVFSRALDAGLVDRSLAVAPVGGGPLQGHATLGRAETEWRFTPAAPWRRGAHELLVLSTLEDPSGNRPARGADAVPTGPEEEPAPADQIRLPFLVR